MPLTTFLGAPTVERHEIRDADGNHAGSTTVIRESPWDEDSRQAAYSLYIDELERCEQCNGPRSECEEPDRLWYPQRHICWKTAANEVAYRRWANANAEVEPDLAGFLPTDGTRLWVATEDLTPDDDFI